MMIFSIIVTLVILGIIIFIHELGHFSTSKFFGIPVSEFALGMGPKLFSFKKNGTEYSLRAIPMGGFVNIEGIEVGDMSENGFNTKKPYQRFIVLFAGVFMNFVLAFGVLYILLVGYGESKIDGTKVGTVIKESGAFGKILENDKIVSIDGKKIEKWNDIQNMFLNYKGTGIANIEFERNGKIFKESINLIKKEERYRIGIAPAFYHQNYNILNGAKRAAEECVNIVTSTFIGFGKIFKGEVKSEEVSSVIGMVKVVNKFMEFGVIPVVYLAAFLSMSVGIMNLLPIPALDGGRILFVIFEKIGIKVDKALEEKIHKVGMAVLIVLIILLTLNDIVNIRKPINI